LPHREFLRATVMLRKRAAAGKKIDG